MLEPSHVDHISMPVPQYPPSDESEGTFRSELRNLVDSRLPLPDDPSSSFASTQSGHVAPRGDGRSSSPERQKRSSKKDRHALAQRELSRMLASEEAEVKSMRKYLKAALDRLDGETRRAQEAERRALEIAERFRVVNEARQTAQSELTRVTEELRLWRNQFENAQKEILRARDVFKDLEEQRNSAESDATRYRTLARKLNEERMINKAREEGRKEGYEEGLRRGMEQGRSDAYNSRSRRDEVLVEDDDEDIRGRGVPDNGPADEIQSVMSESIAPLNIPTRVPLNNLSLRGGTQFHEHFTPTSTATRSLAPVQETSEPRMARPPSVIHNRPPSIGRPDSTPPPDNWIPELDPATNTFAVPPAHVMNRSPSSLNPPLPDSSNISANYAQVPETNVKDIYPQKSRSSPPSIAESIQSSTATSQYEILAPTRGQGQRKEREIPRQMLDRIDEVSSSMEHSPGMEKRAMPTAVTFPVASAGDPEWEGSHGSRSRKTSHQSLGHGSPRSRTLSQGGGHRQMLSNESRYSQSSIDSWRRDAASTLDPPKQYPAAASVSKPAYPSGLRHEVNPPTSSRDDRPRSATTPRPRSPAGPRSTTPVGNRLDVQARLRSLQASPSSGISSSTEFNIVVEPPSGTASLSSPKTVLNSNMLSPNAGPEPLPLPADLVPTEPNTPTMRQPSLGPAMPPPTIIGGLPAGFIPMGPPSAVPMQHTKTHPGGLPGGPTWSMKAPERTTSAQGRSTPAYEVAPTPEGFSYPTPPFGRPRDSPRESAAGLDAFSPRSNSSRLSAGHQRSLSMNAGATPGMSALPLSANPAPKLRKMPSSESVGSNRSASMRSEDLLGNMQSPTTAANTKVNAGMRSMGGFGGFGGFGGASQSPVIPPPPILEPEPELEPQPIAPVRGKAGKKKRR